MDFLADLQRTWRSLRRSPGFVAAAVQSLGLATGASVAGFGVMDAVRGREGDSAGRRAWLRDRRGRHAAGSRAVRNTT